MNNYILNSGTCNYGNTYNYIETNNHYACPYVFKTNDDVAQKYVYFKDMPTISGSGTMGYKDPDGNEEMGSVPIYYTIKAYGVATIKEAAEIGGTTSDSSQLIIKNSLSDYNCDLKETTTIEYDSNNQCINYDDIKEAVYRGPYILCQFSFGNQTVATGYIGGNSSNDVIPIRNYSILYDTINNSFSKKATLQRQFFKFMNGSGAQTHDISSFYINKIGNTSSTMIYDLLHITTYTKQTASNVPGRICDNNGNPTGQTTNLGYYFDPGEFDIHIEDVNNIIALCHDPNNNFSGDGSLETPYNVYFNIICQ